MSRVRLVTVTAAALLLAPAAAHANGRFPTTVGIHFKPGDHQTFALAATWGLMTTKDGGQTFYWSCEEAVGFGGIYDPDYEFTRTGALLATTTSIDGLRVTRDLCHYEPAPPPLGVENPNADNPSTFVAQVEIGFDDRIYAAASNAISPTEVNSQIYLSTDDAVSWTVLANPGGGVDWWESLEASPVPLAGDQTRLFLAGYNFEDVTNNKLRVLFRSDDSGVTWDPLPVTDFTFGGNSSDLQIFAVSPTNADVVFARVQKASGSSIGDDIYRSINGGDSWTRVFQANDDVTAVVVRESGEVIVATALSGTFVSTDGGATFPATATDAATKINCMKERDDGTLFACGVSYAPDLMALGTGTVGDWTPIFTFDKLCAAVQCPHDTAQWDVCESQRWPATVEQYGIVPPAACGAAGPDAAPGDGGTDDPPPKTCCSAGTPTEALLLGLLVALPLSRRRRRKAQLPS
jgi:hypothetical protein